MDTGIDSTHMLMVAKEECCSFCVMAREKQTTPSRRYERPITNTNTDNHPRNAIESHTTPLSFHITIHALSLFTLIEYEIRKANQALHYSTWMPTESPRLSWIFTHPIHSNSNTNSEKGNSLLFHSTTRGFGEVFLALDKSSSDLVAIKKTKIISYSQQVEKEAKTLKECTSKFIVKYFDVIHHNDEFWVTPDSFRQH